VSSTRDVQSSLQVSNPSSESDKTLFSYSSTANMFSTETPPPSHGHSLRPKRSRRAGSDDSIKLPQAKRRRSALRRDTFEPLNDISPNEVAVSANGSLTDGHAPADTSEFDGAFSASKELTLRAAKKVDKRNERGSGTLTLVSGLQKCPGRTTTDLWNPSPVTTSTA
jgi:hypothetical protein